MTQAAVDIGSRIRRAREQRGQTLAEIAHTTKISIAALKAIERSDFARLPGGVFNTAYVRAYAAAVGLEPDEYVREYRTRFEPALTALPSSGDRPGDRGRFIPRHRPLYRLVAALVVSLGILIGAGLLLSRYIRNGDDVPSIERGLKADEADRPSVPLQPAADEPQDAAGLD